MTNECKIHVYYTTLYLLKTCFQWSYFQKITEKKNETIEDTLNSPGCDDRDRLFSKAVRKLIL